MKVPEIEEILDTFDAAYEAKLDISGGMAHNSECNRAGLLAVFETHVRKMLAEAFKCGADCQLDNTRRVSLTGYGRAYANERLTQLKEPRHD